MTVSAVINLLKFELRRLATPVRALIFVLVVWVIYVWWFPGNSQPDTVDPAFIASAIYAAAVGLGVTLVIRLGLGYPSRRTDAVWRTRPIAKGTVVTVSLLLIFALIMAFTLAITLAKMAWGFTWSESVWGIWLPALTALAFSIAGVLLASVAGSWGRFCGLVSLVLMLVVGSITLLAQLSMPSPVGLFLDGVLEWRICVAVVGVLTITLLLWIEHGSSRTPLIVLAMVVGLALCFVSVPLLPVYGTGLFSGPEPEIEELEAISVKQGDGVDLPRKVAVVQIPQKWGTGGWRDIRKADFWFEEIDPSGSVRGQRHPMIYDDPGWNDVWRGGRYDGLEHFLEPMQMVNPYLPHIPTPSPPTPDTSRTEGQPADGKSINDRMVVNLPNWREVADAGTLGGSYEILHFKFNRKGVFDLSVENEIRIRDEIVQLNQIAVEAAVTGGRPYKVAKVWGIRKSLQEGARSSTADRGIPLRWDFLDSSMRLFFVHPDGGHAIKVNAVFARGYSVAGMDWSEFYLEMRLADDQLPARFPPIDESEVPKLKLLVVEPELSRIFRVTIPPTPWEF